MRDAGYSYLFIDDGWNEDRDANGRQQANKTVFPSGIPALTSYARDRRLKLGLYRHVKNEAAHLIQSLGLPLQ
jgi:alpha-galactosidase